MDFTAHNVQLRDGLFTRPGDPYEIADNALAQFSASMLKWTFGDDLTKASIIDIGCLEGGYTVAFARLGMTSVGLEVRQSNFINCEYVKANTDLPTLSFVKDDLRNMYRHGIHDAVFCCGVLYHMDKPAEILKLLSQHCRTLLILDTHIADPEKTARDLTLSELTKNEGYEGRWYEEFDEEDPQVESAKWGSWRNNKSFWPTKPSLVAQMKAAGFDLVLEHHIFDSEREANQRVTFLGIKTSIKRICSGIPGADLVVDGIQFTDRAEQDIANPSNSKTFRCVARMT